MHNLNLAFISLVKFSERIKALKKLLSVLSIFRICGMITVFTTVFNK